MSISIQSLLNSRFGVGLALGLGRATPRCLGYRLAGFAAARIASQRSLDMVRAVRANQWVVGGEKLTPNQLDSAVQAVFANTARCLYDLYHHLDDPSAAQRLIVYNRRAEEMIERSRQGRAGTVIVGVHMSNFDLVLQAAGRRGLRAQVISTTRPGKGYRWQNELRSRTGLEITPGSRAALRQALTRLQAGGSVLTGVDRPAHRLKYRPLFFGRPASLPVHHIVLALRAQAPVYVFAALMEPDGTYRITASEPVTMRPYSDRQREILFNAQAVLEAAEDFIRQAPHQWSMFYPVWPEVLEENLPGQPPS